ncbi:MAG: arsenite methyltransferase [Proteobacteria bacterium]|nr:arsenite methyltransferase [Pseudomonadota bacterium]MBU1742937.1 arsenite methyltransferase [Pseudomonadota bacterium]
MEPIQDHEIRQAVRDRYGQIARQGAAEGDTSPAPNCCSGADVSLPPRQEAGDCRAGGCCGGEQTKQEQLGAVIGYSQSDLEGVVQGANLGLGCGNPVALASLQEGETVLDLGSGGGFDCFLTAKEVGPSGQVIGVDMTPEMIALARANAQKMGATNVEFRLGEIEHLPAADHSVDLIMSNCVINLSPDKQAVFDEAYRVLRPGGRLAVADVVATAALPDDVRQDLALVSACIGGAATIDDIEAMLQRAGFQDIKISPRDQSRALLQEWAPGGRAQDYVVSADIEAMKPQKGETEG